MSNVESAAKADVSAARTGIRAWMANHPFLYGAIAFGTGIALAIAVHIFL